MVIQADAALQKLVNVDTTVVSVSTIACYIQAVVVSAMILKNQWKKHMHMLHVAT